MRVTERTQYATVRDMEKYFAPEFVEELTRAAEAQYGAMYDLTFAEFHALANGDFSRLGDMSNPTVLQVYWTKRFAAFVDEFANTLKRLQVKPTADEEQAATGLLQVSWAEGLLVFLQRFFGLQSYKQAEQITLGELLIAKRAQYNEDMYKRRLQAIQLRKMRKQL